MFESEKILVETTLPKLNELFNVKESNIVLEAKGLFGIPDVVLNNGNLIAIEFKLSNWKSALTQAFRYKSFADQSYVFIDNGYVHRALKHIDKFKNYNIGLYSVDDNGDIINFYTPYADTTYATNIREKALSMFS